MTVDEIKKKLDEYGISYNHSAKKDELEQMLETAEREIAKLAEPVKEQPEQEELPGTLMSVKCELLNLRTEPDNDMKPETVASVLKKGETVRVMDIVDGWAQVMGGTYCKAEFLE